MSAEDKDKATFLLRDVPGDVVREIGARAETNYRSRSGEILAILTAVCRGHVALPVSMDGATVAALKPQDDLVPDPLDADALGSLEGQRSDFLVVDDPGFEKSKGGDV